MCRIHTAAAVSAILAGALVHGVPSSAVAVTAAAASNAEAGRSLLFKISTGDGVNEGDEGDEGNEGLDDLLSGGFGDFDGGDAGDEGDEGEEGNEGDEGDEGGATKRPPRRKRNDGDEGNEGNEGDEGDEGNEGSGFESITGLTGSDVTCTSQASASSFADASDANAIAQVDIALGLCADGAKAFSDAGGTLVTTATNDALALATAFAGAQASCVSAGNSFGCSSATATAEAWAEASAEAHATAVAKAARDCDACDVDAAALSVGRADVFIELIADVFARAEVTACSEGDGEAVAVAFTNCVAEAYATVFAKVGLSADAFNSATV